MQFISYDLNRFRTILCNKEKIRVSKMWGFSFLAYPRLLFCPELVGKHYARHVTSLYALPALLSAGTGLCPDLACPYQTGERLLCVCACVCVRLHTVCHRLIAVLHLYTMKQHTAQSTCYAKGIRDLQLSCSAPVAPAGCHRPWPTERLLARTVVVK